MKRKLLVCIAIIGLLLVSGCNKFRQSALDFKKEYEDINGRVIKVDLKYRTLNISENNPYIKVTINEILKKLENKETFYLYVGDPLCPWCRSGLEKMIEVANNAGIEDIYYIDFWDDDHNEILRDLYEVQTVNKKNQVVKIQDAASGYDTLLASVSQFAQDYTLTKDDKVYEVGVKRIFGGDHFYFENGVCKKYVSLRSDKLENAFDDLTDEVLKDQQEKFEEFFETNKACVGGESNC